MRDHSPDKGSQPQGVTLGGVPTKGENPQPQTPCSKRDRLNWGLQRGSVYILLKSHPWSDTVVLTPADCGSSPRHDHSHYKDMTRVGSRGAVAASSQLNSWRVARSSWGRIERLILYVADCCAGWGPADGCGCRNSQILGHQAPNKDSETSGWYFTQP